MKLTKTIKLNRLALLLAGLGVLTGTSQAVTTSVIAVPGSAQTTSGVDTFTTTGGDMGGMSVTVTFAGGGTETVAWAATGATSGNAVGTGWTISQAGTTFSNPWTFSGVSITGIAFDGAPGDTMFDRTLPNQGTPDSASGTDFAFTDVTGLDSSTIVTATYSDVIGIGANPPVTDLYRRLTINFDTPSRGSFAWVADTDNAALENDIRPTPDGGTTLALLGLSLMGIYGAKKRRK